MFDFLFILFSLTVISAAVWLVDSLFLAKKRQQQGIEKLPLLVDYAKSFFPIFLLVFALRSFVAQPFKVPSGSLVPTVIPGDILFVNQYKYGVRFPIWNKKILKVSEPKRGEVVVFHWPVNPSIDFVKRVIGVPGDQVSYINKVVYVNGQQASQQFISDEIYGDDNINLWPVKKMQEDLLGVKHDIYLCADHAKQCPGGDDQDFYNLTIPEGYYFMMGDNRDDSDDSRGWGLVPEENLVGKAEMIIFSWNSQAPLLDKIRFKRIGNRMSH